MNIEFVKSTDGNKLVTNENGEIFQSINSKRNLLLENKVELLNNLINQYQTKVDDSKRIILGYKWLFTIILIISLMLDYGLIKHFEGLRTILPLGYLNIIFPSLWYFVVSSTKKDISKLEMILEKAMQIKEDAEKELALAKEKQIDLSEERDIPVNEPVSLVEENKREETIIRKEIEEYLANTLESQHGLTLSRKKKRLSR